MTQASNNTGKVQLIHGTPLFIRNMVKDHTLQIYYLYLNPLCDDPINNLRDYFLAALPQSLKTSSFCMPSCLERFLTEDHRIKMMMQISPLEFAN